MTVPPCYRIGVDVGGTNTDAVVINKSAKADDSPILASFKHPTTADVTEGIEKAIEAVLKMSGVDSASVKAVMIGTTHFINAVVTSDRRLRKVAVIRLGAPYTTQIPPWIDVPANLREVIEGYSAICSGGLQIDGSAIGAIDADELHRHAAEIKKLGIKAVALVGVYSPLDADGTSQEEQARSILQDALGPDVDIVCCRHVGQNDGTLITATRAAQFPIRTFASGATNSMRGAAYLAGLHAEPGSEGKTAIVCDIGGTTTDVGVLLPSGFPRQAAAFTKSADFAMPDVQSIGLGGGSHVNIERDTHGKLQSVTVGSTSVGYNLIRDGLVFGGKILTATDIVSASAVASGDLSETKRIGDLAKVARIASDAALLAGAQASIKKKLEALIDKMKTSPEPATVLLVGGGSVIAPDELEGVLELIRPPYFGCANAVGAAVANVSGEVDTIEILEDRSLDDVLDSIKSQAMQKAVQAGAKAKSVKVVEVENLPVQYVTNKATRLIVRAAGELDADALASIEVEGLLDYSAEEDNRQEPSQKTSGVPAKALEQAKVDIATYRPTITKDKEWLVSELDLGGGGSTYPPFLVAREIIRKGGVIRVTDIESLPDHALLARGHFMGSPSVSNERLQAGTELATAWKHLSSYLGVRKPSAICIDEIGGGNGVWAFVFASDQHIDCPVWDGDLIGSAYPNMYQTVPAAFNVPKSTWPCAIADGLGNAIVMPAAESNRRVEKLLRTACTVLGSKAGVSMAPLRASQCRSYGIQRSVSQAWRIGRAVAQSRAQHDLGGVPRRILELQSGKCLFIGKIVDVAREVRAGFTWGSLRIAPLSTDEEEHAAASSAAEERGAKLEMRLEFQNEFIWAGFDRPDGSREVTAIVPDLITVIDSQSGSCLATNELRYGLRVTVLALVGDPKWTSTPEGLATGGPEDFGLHGVPYTPCCSEPYKVPRSVIEEFSS